MPNAVKGLFDFGPPGTSIGIADGYFGKYVTLGTEKRVGLTTKQIVDMIEEKFGGLKLSTKECYEKY